MYSVIPGYCFHGSDVEAFFYELIDCDPMIDPRLWCVPQILWLELFDPNLLLQQLTVLWCQSHDVNYILDWDHHNQDSLKICHLALQLEHIFVFPSIVSQQIPQSQQSGYKRNLSFFSKNVNKNDWIQVVLKNIWTNITNNFRVYAYRYFQFIVEIRFLFTED